MLSLEKPGLSPGKSSSGSSSRSRPSARKTPAQTYWEEKTRERTPQSSDRLTSLTRSTISGLQHYRLGSEEANLAGPRDDDVVYKESKQMPANTTSTYGLQRFRFGSQDTDIEGRKYRVSVHDKNRERHRSLLSKLKAHAEHANLPSWRKLLFPLVPRPALPDDEQLIELAQEVFPLRMEVSVHVCDIGRTTSSHYVTTLGDVEACWKEKPDDVVVRWIHAPVGLGILHSSIEDMFRHDRDPGKSFEHAGTPGWPFVEIDSLHLRHRADLQEGHDTHDLLKPKSELYHELRHRSFEKDSNETLKQDLAWRIGHLGQNDDFWSSVASDLPTQLSEGIAFGTDGPIDAGAIRPKKRGLDPSVIGKHPQFREAQLVRSPFRFFHREDGVILTMSSAKGINYINRDFQHHLRESSDAILNDPNVSVVGNMMRYFQSTGTQTWHKESVEWFLVYLLTELTVTPHNEREGLNAISIVGALQAVVQDLKQRRYDDWKPTETPRLVKEFLLCVDEVKALKTIFARNLKFLDKLAAAVAAHDAEDEKNGKLPNDPEGESSASRIRWATLLLTKQVEDCDRLLADLLQALDTFFQLRAIEQSELAITTHNQNKAIVIFTGVTVVFLPLSFFTSYFGMNVQGIINTARSEAYFWKVCGSIALIIVCVVSITAFNQRFWRQRREGREMRKFKEIV